MKPKAGILLIIGGSRGIGAATAQVCAPLFDQVVITYRQQREAAEAVASQLDTPCTTFALDVADEAAVVELFTAIDNLDGQLTGLVNSAGIVAPATTAIHIDGQRLQTMFATNVFGTFYCCREALKRMAPGGSIVNVGSAASKHGSPEEYVDYAASKGAVDVLTLGLAKEAAAKNIRVNCVRPGIIDTDIHADSGDRDRPRKLAPQVPLQRPGQADEVARAIAWLLSSESSYTTGSLIDVTGGR